MALLEVTDLRKTYRIKGQDPIPVLKGISFSVEPGDRVAIVGRSGAGKSTLLNLLGGLDKPDSGSVTLDGVSLFGGAFAARRRTRVRAEKIGFVFQAYHLMPELTVLENVLLPAMNGGRTAAAEKKARELLAEVGLSDRIDHLPDELSGGEQQRVAVARALMNDPVLILADEPTGNLDSMTGSEILKLLFNLPHSERMALVMVTHSQEAASVCNRTLRLEAGKL